MRVERFILLGEREPALDVVALTRRERATLAAAARILHELRGNLEPDTDLETDVALAAHTLDDIGAMVSVAG